VERDERVIKGGAPGLAMWTLVAIEQDIADLRTRLSSPEAALVDLFLNRISSWREDDSTVEELLADVDRLLGHTWFRSNEDHARVALDIARLRDTIAGIGGMTMNERLFTFDLLERWDRASEPEREVLYGKVLASR
jgi:hypothetical protein